MAPKLGRNRNGSKFKIFGSEINIEYKQIQKKIFEQMMRIIMTHNIFKGFLVYLILKESVSKSLKWQFLYF